MELTVLGRYGPYPRPGGACSGYLIADGETRVLLECGAGTLSRLMRVLPLNRIDAVVLSHLHYDHCSDIAVLRYALEQLSARDGIRSPMPVYAPDAPQDACRLLEYPAFARHAICGGMRETIGSLELSFHAMAHPVPTCGMMIAGSGGERLFYTGDTGYFAALPELARGAEALLADACLTDADEPKENPVHMTAREVGKLSKAAGIRRTFLTHLWGGADTEAAVQKEVDMPGAVVVQELGHYMISHKHKKEE